MNKGINLSIILLLLVGIAIGFSANINITSPAITIISGENVVLAFSSNESLIANYSLDGSAEIPLGTGNQFSTILNGNLPHGVIENGNHAVIINLRNGFQDIFAKTHNFQINDDAAPLLSINLTNNSAYTNTEYNLRFLIQSNEFAKASYAINLQNNTFEDLGPAKSMIVSIPVIAGQNQLLINISDYQYNFAVYSFDFDFLIASAPSCFDAIQNQGETGIDCGGPCASCIAFSISTNKAVYNITDSVQLTVLSRQNSTVAVTIKRNNENSWRYNFVPVFAGAPIAETRVIGNTSISGNYTIEAIMTYLNLTETKYSQFEVIGQSQSPIALSINANATTVNEGSHVLFISTVQNNISSVSYRWDFQNDGVIDSTESQASYVFANNGTYKVNLTVTDGTWNQTDIKIITVRKLFNVTVFVRDNSTGSPLHLAEIELEDEFANTTPEGRVDLQKPQGDDYDLVVRKAGYSTFSNSTKITGNVILDVNLIEIDVAQPIIQFVYPANGETIQNNSVVIRYIANDKSQMTCSIFESSNSTQWTRRATDSFVRQGIESSLALSDLQNGSHQIQIECIDRRGNKNLSEVYSIRIDPEIIGNILSVDLEEQDRIANDLLQEIDQALQNIGSFESEEKEAADEIRLSKQLERAKTEIQRANRDLHSLKWRRLNESGLEAETKSILARIENLRREIPRNIRILEKNEFVSYPSKDDVSSALELQIKSTNYKFSKREMKNLVDEVHKLQKSITVTTKIKIAEIEYISGGSNTITIIQKTITNNHNHDNLVFYEIIPKSIANNVSDLNALFDFEVIQDDPVIKIDTQKIKEYIYYVNKHIPFKDAEGIKSILLQSQIRKQKDSSITGLVTGFIPSEGFVGGLIETSNIRLIVEIVVIIALLLVFLYYQIGGMEKIELMFNRQLANQIKEFEFLAVRAENYIEQHRYEEAKVVYKDLAILFAKLPKQAREKLHAKVLEIHHKVDYLFMSISLDSAFSALNQKDIKKALHLYNKISSLYKSLPKNLKPTIHSKCIELYKKING